MVTPPSSQPQTGLNQNHLFVWVKGLETKVNNLLREVDLLKNDFIKKNTNLRKEVRTMNEELLELKRAQDKTGEKIDIIIKELKRTAGIEEVETLKKYVEFWNPMNFVTLKDLERALAAGKDFNNYEDNKENDKKGKVLHSKKSKKGD